jgi:DNA-directed RNA polymerase specialized sigma24 family protein
MRTTPLKDNAAMSQERIAAELGCSVGYVNKVLRQAMSKLSRHPAILKAIREMHFNQQGVTR